MRKSRYGYYWNNIVRVMLIQYKQLSQDSIQAAIFKMAIDKATSETLILPDGDLRVQAIRLIYIDNITTVDGAALRLNCSRRTIQRWTASFIKLVAKYAGYM